MSAYWPPLENLPTFDVLVFRQAQDVVDYAITTGTANNIADGVAGDLLYQSAPSTTAKLPIGTNTYILTSNGSTPLWSPPSVVSTPTLANVLLAGNSAGATNIDMNTQSITNATAMTATTFNGALNGNATTASTANTINTTTLPGASAFYYLNYVDTSTGATSRTVYTNSSFYFNPASGILAGAVINLFGGLGNVSATASSRLINNTFYNLMDNTAVVGGVNRGNLTTTSTIASLNLTSATHRFTITNNSGAITTFSIDPADLTITTTNNPTITGFTDPAASNSSNNIASTRWVQSAITAGTSSLANNIAGGTAGALLYQSAPNVTAKLAIGANTYFLTSNGTAPVWTPPTTPTISTTQTTTVPYYLVGSSSQGTSSDTTLYKSSTGQGVYVNPATNDIIIGGVVMLNTSTNPFYISFLTPSSDDVIMFNNCFAGGIANNTFFYNLDSTGSQRTVLTLNGDIGASTFDGLSAASTTVAVADNNTATTMYPVFTTATAGQKSLLFDTTTTAWKYKPSTGELAATRYSLGGILEPVAGDNAGFLAQNTGSSATVVQNQATSGLIHLATTNSINVLTIPLIISSANLTTNTINCPTITGFTAPPTNDNTAKIATTSWVQSALTSGVATATTVAVADNDTATTMYPIFTTATAGQKSLLFDSTTTPLRYKPSSGVMSSVQFAVGGFVEPVAGDNAGLISQNTGSVATIIQNQATSGLIRLATRDASNALAIPFQISFSDCNITTTNSPVIYARNILVDNGSTLPITIGNGSSTSTSNIIMTSNSLASTRVFTAGGNVIIGAVAGNSLPVGATDNTFIGDAAGGTTTGSSNICIGYNSQVPTVANSNQIAIGTVAETMYIRGGFNYRVGTQITSTATGNLATAVLAQFYTVAMTAAAQTIALPNPTTAAYLGAKVIFKRKTNTTVFTITSTGGAGFVPIGSITLSASPISIAATVFQVELVCDGVNWNIISQA